MAKDKIYELPTHFSSADMMFSEIINSKQKKEMEKHNTEVAKKAKGECKENKIYELPTHFSSADMMYSEIINSNPKKAAQKHNVETKKETIFNPVKNKSYEQEMSK